MSWKVLGPRNDILQMTEGDFGVALKLTLKNYNISANDRIDFVVVKQIHGEELLKKTFINIEGNTVYIMLTQQETSQIAAGEYIYRVDWYQNGVFMDNLSRVGIFRVVIKA